MRLEPQGACKLTQRRSNLTGRRDLEQIKNLKKCISNRRQLRGVMIKKILLFMSVTMIVFGPLVASAEPTRDSTAAAISIVRELDRPGRINLATVWDGNKYVQCRRTLDKVVLCEAGGSLMQVSLQRVLTAQRLDRLSAMGWSLDPSFGNFVRAFGPTTTAESIADDVLAALSQGYDADMRNLEIETTSVRREACPPRNGPSQNLAGMINDSPSMAAVAIHACAYRPDGDAPTRKMGPQSTIADLIALYGPRVTVEIRRLRINMHRKVFAVFDAGLGYVQCRPETDPNIFLCEAQSTDSWPELAAVLTPARIDRLHAAGFADPGRSPNYSKSYVADTIGDAALAAEILTVLHDVYGYFGATALRVTTEEN